MADLTEATIDTRIGKRVDMDDLSPGSLPWHIARLERLTGELGARRQIIAACNRHAFSQNIYRMRHLQQCVSMCRRRGLVKPDVLVAAGFRAVK